MCSGDPWLHFTLCLSLIILDRFADSAHVCGLRLSYLFMGRNRLDFVFDIIAVVKYGLRFQKIDKTGVEPGLIGAFAAYLTI